jgi:PPOX class probable F420-dependent enzyme
MANQRAQIVMSHDEQVEFLHQSRSSTVASTGANGQIHLVAMWYAVLDEHIWIETKAKSQKVVNLRRDPRITCLVEDGEDYFELRGATIFGKARLLEDYDELVDLGGRVARRMAGGADIGELGEQIVSHQATKRVGVIVEPDKIATWDHRKMTAPPGGNR